ncbi:valine--tRNA ligase [soil metagenome]
MKLSKTYEPGQYETDIYDLWEKSGAFKPSDKGEPFVTIMPPPNANANLHIGHALNNALQDIAIRYQRMNGRAALFIPGADHAGFETQVVYEKHLAKEGKSRFDFSREELYKQIYDFVQKNRGNVEAQVRALGASVDWSRSTFTLDEQVIKTAYSTFKKLWDDNLVYRGERLVNYCTFHRTSFADIEVKYEERTSPLYYLKYGPFVLATTRPETKFGDTAVAVHPDDKRYKDYVGKIIQAEGIEEPFEIRVVADEYVDPAFGTGAVKITPAHDFNDWEVAQRHNLEAIRVINHDGTLNHRAGKFEGMPVAEARKAVAEALIAKGLMDHVDEQYQNRVGVCYKCGTVIEPMLMDQWFIEMKKLSGPALKALKAGKITFYPAQKRQQVMDYLEGVKDWNISRQIAWGIPIPAFQNLKDSDDWIFDERVGEETIEKDGKTYKRDPDVFDTWFSSGQWPFITTGYTDGQDFERFYPNSLMETGIDIVYPWVSRMICLGLYVTGEIPFKDVYLHGMVRSEDGRKMSKSLGNVIDPHEVIASHGSDALRMGMIAGRSAGESAAYDPSKVHAARNFCNKLWNVARYVEDVIGDNFEARKAPELISIADHWMLRKLQHTTESISTDLDNYRFSEAYDTLYHAVWDDFADWYLEAGKGSPNHGMLAYGLETLLKLAHPFAPFVTETIWQTLKWEKDSLLITSAWPEETLKADERMVKDFETAQALVTECRVIMNNLGLHKPVLNFTDEPFMEEHGGLMTRLGRLTGVEKGDKPMGLRLNSVPFVAWIAVDPETASKYLSKLEEQQTGEVLSVERLRGRLGNASYVENAPESLVAETKAQLEASESRLKQITAEIDSFNSSTGSL